MPRNRRAWASWNYHRLEPKRDRGDTHLRSQPSPGHRLETPVLVTLNQDDAIDPELVLARMEYAHPVLDSRHGRRPAAPPRSTVPGGPGSAAPTGAMGSTRTACAARCETCRALGVTCVTLAQAHELGMASPGGGLRSALYEGHRAAQPVAVRTRAGPTHVLLQGGHAVARPGGGRCRHWGCTRCGRPAAAAPVRFRRPDFLGDPAVPLDRCGAGPGASERTGRRPEGPIALLANLRTWGWLFNPIGLYFCAERRRCRPSSTLVVEVENTPWHERCSYVVGPPGRHRFAKAHARVALLAHGRRLRAALQPTR